MGFGSSSASSYLKRTFRKSDTHYILLHLLYISFLDKQVPKVHACKPCASFVGLIEYAFWVKKDKGTVVLALILEYLVYAWHIYQIYRKIGVDPLTRV